MRPTLRFLEEELITRIVDEARDLLKTLGVTILNPEVLSLFADHGAEVDLPAQHVKYTDEIIDKALETAPGSFQLYDVLGNQTHDFSGNNVHFVPGSTAINVQDSETGEIRRPETADYIRYAKLMGSLDNIAARVYLSRHAYRMAKPSIDAGLDTLNGDVYTFTAPEGPCYECRLKDADRQRKSTAHWDAETGLLRF